MRDLFLGQKYIHVYEIEVQKYVNLFMKNVTIIAQTYLRRVLMRKILILTSSFIASTKDLSNYEIVYNNFKRKINRLELISLLDSDVIGIIAGLEDYDIEVLKYSPNLRVISRCGAGIDNISSELIELDLIKIYSTPDAPTDSVVELTIGLILNLLRQINRNDKDLKQGKWIRLNGTLLQGKTVGILGLGRIGLGVANLLNAFGANVQYYDLNEKPDVEFKFCSLEELLINSDIVSIHLPYNLETKNIINKERLSLLKENAYIINTSRGGLIDEIALYHMLKEKRLAGAGLDVFSEEPYNGLLLSLDNVLLTPHIGSYTLEGRLKQEEYALKNLLRGLEE
jgi:D-3-phosphoglycerate dehydrogenase